ncbi:MAG: LuxR C-terminal-related transcriptional regulator [Tetrasphaera sp.]
MLSRLRVPMSSGRGPAIIITDQLGWFSQPGIVVCDPLKPAMCRRVMEGLTGGSIDAAVLTTALESQLPAALRGVRSQVVSFPTALVAAAEGSPVLSARQHRVLALVVAGVSYPRIGLRLDISTATVKREVVSLFVALGCGNRTQLALAAVDGGYVDLAQTLSTRAH